MSRTCPTKSDGTFQRIIIIRKFSFTNRIVNIWNSLPNAVVDVDSVDLFKTGLGNFV